MKALLTLFLLTASLTMVPSPARGALTSSCTTTPVIAHRGIWTDHTENTMGSVNAAVSASAPFEVDLRSTADDQVVVMHDPTVDRTTNGTGRVDGLTADAVAALQTNDGQHVPRAEEILDLLAAEPSVHAHLELKALSQPAMSWLTGAIQQRGISAQVTVDSFDASLLASIREHLSDVPAYLIYEDLPQPSSLTFNASVYTRSMTQEWADAVHARGLEFRARLTDGPHRYEAWDLGLKYGVTSFMTDRLADFRSYCARKLLPRPDTWIRTTPSGRYAGDDVYNTSGAGQTKTLTARRNRSRTFYLRIYNEADSTRTYVVKASAARAESRVWYWSGGHSVHSALRSRGGWRITLAPGAHRQVGVRIKVRAHATIGSLKPITVTAAWAGDRSRADVARAVVRVGR